MLSHFPKTYFCIWKIANMDHFMFGNLAQIYLIEFPLISSCSKKKETLHALCTVLCWHYSTALPRLLLSETATSTQTLLSQSVIMITRYKSGAILFWVRCQLKMWQFFPKKCHFQIISHGQWWTKKFHPFLDSTYQEWMIFARIGDGPCNYY